MKQPNWRLRKTLKRPIEIRSLQPDDLKYLWAAYKKGCLGEIGLGRFADTGMDAEQFRQAFDEIAAAYNDGWIVVAHTRRGYLPAGVMLGTVAPLGAYMVIAGAAWFPWATRRNVIEGTVAFLNAIRKQFPALWYATEQHKRLYEVCCMHGVARRIGTSFSVFPGRQAAVYETRAKDT